MKYFVLDLYPVKESDGVVKRSLRIIIDDQPEQLIELPGETTQSPEFPAEHDMNISGRLVDSDAAGNESEPTSFSFVVDVTAPHKPGAIGLRVITRDDPVETSEEPSSSEEASTSEEQVETSEEPSSSEEVSTSEDVETSVDPFDI